MKHLTDTLKSPMTSLYESIFDDDIVTRKIEPEEHIRDFLQKNYKLNPEYITINQNERTKEYVIDVNGSVYANSDIESLTDGLFKFGCISGNFDCSHCANLKSLEGGPKEVGGRFYCFSCTSLTSLKGAPKEVGEDFDCSHCTSLTSLEGAPKVCRNFNCKGCVRLKSLKGLPEIIKQNLHCSGCGVDFSKEEIKKYSKVRK